MEARWVSAGAALLALLAFAPALTGGFSYDDLEAIRGNPVIEGSAPWWTAFTRDYWEHLGAAGHWRPAATLSLRLVHGFFGESAPAQHAASILLHACAAALLAGLLLRLSLGTAAAALGAALFAAHPALADGVAWISGRSSPVSAVGGLVGLHLVLRARSATTVALAAALAVLLAALGKEDGLTFAPVAVLLAARHGHERAGFLGALLGGVAWATLRLATYGEALPSAPGSPLANLDLWEREALGGWAWLGGLRALLLPVGLVPGRAPLVVETWAEAWPLAGVFVAHALPVLGLTLSWRALAGPRAQSLAAASLGCACLATLPTLQLVPAGEVFATRFLYLPLLFAAPAMSMALTRLGPAPVLALLATFVPLSWHASAPYASREAYWQARRSAEPEDARVWNALGNAALELGDEAAAEERFLRALELDPDYSRPRVNLGVLLVQRGEHERAEAVLAEACARGPRNPVAHQNHGAVLLRLERWKQAAQAYGRATELAPGAVAAWRGLARARQALGQSQGARDAIERALTLDPRDARSRALLEQLGGSPLQEP
jgi:Flp pilus assembly protein TadD